MTKNLAHLNKMSDYWKGDPFKHSFFSHPMMTRDSLDDLFSVFESPATYPKYNVIQKADGGNIVEVAVAGYAKEDLDVSLTEGKLTISGDIKSDEDADEPNYIARYISSRKFTLDFPVSPGTKVDSAKYQNGILTVDLSQEETAVNKIEIV